MQVELNRREAMGVLGAAALAFGLGGGATAAEGKKRLGIGTHSFGMHWQLAKASPERARFTDALGFLKFCHELGAGGVQVALGADAEKAAAVRRKADEYGMYLEGQTQLPRNESDVERFEADLRAAKAAEVKLLRTVMLSGRRYEVFDTLEQFNEFARQSWQSLVLAAPLLQKHRTALAIENHKDWLAAEFLKLLERISSEYVRVCIDTGNNIALLEDTIELVEALAPYVVSVHLKDMAVAEDREGFLLAEVPLGRGVLDLKRIIAICNQANPVVQFSLEMITRDPLKVPCLTDKYWATFENRSGKELARTLSMVREKAPREGLPRVSQLTEVERLAAEIENVRVSLEYARAELEM